MKTIDYTGLDQAKAKQTADMLQQLLADYQIYYTNLRGFHWNIKGKMFFMLHEKFEGMYDEMSDAIDEVAERILMLGETPKNRFSDYLKIAKVKELDNVSCGKEALENVLETLKLLIAQERAIYEFAGEYSDEVTASLMSGYISSKEKQIWMLTAMMSHHSGESCCSSK